MALSPIQGELNGTQIAIKRALPKSFSRSAPSAAAANSSAKPTNGTPQADINASLSAARKAREDNSEQNAKAPSSSSTGLSWPGWSKLYQNQNANREDMLEAALQQDDVSSTMSRRIMSSSKGSSKSRQRSTARLEPKITQRGGGRGRSMCVCVSVCMGASERAEFVLRRGKRRTHTTIHL